MLKTKRFLKDNLIYILVFIFFTYVIFRVPPVADRWMEGIASYELESPWRYLFGQWRWIETANCRIFSNIFSMIVDRNLMVRAITNAFMLSAIAWLITKICTKDIENTYTKYLVVFCMVLVSWGIQREVYFYAATLYIGGILILFLAFYFMQKVRLQTISQREKRVMYILIFVGSTWIENVSMALLGSVLACFIISFWEGAKTPNKTYGIGLAVCAAGLALMFINSIFASAGRLSKAKRLELTFDNMAVLIYDNILLFGILAVAAVTLCIKVKRQIYGKHKIFVQIQCVYWLAILGICLLMGLKHIYDIISTDPVQVDYVNLVFGWKNFGNPLINRFFDGSVYLLMWTLLPALLLAGIISIMYLLYHNGILAEGCVLLGMGAMGSAIDLLGLQKGARISSPAVFALIGLIALVFSKSMDDIAKTEHYLYKGFLFLIGIVAIINIDSMLTFVHIQRGIADERQDIADSVRKQQMAGSWDYNDWVVMPKYDSSEERHTLIGGKRINPHNKDDYYDILLRYYHLDSDTKLIFSDDDVQLIKLMDSQYENAALCLNIKKKWNNAKYKFILYDKSLNNILEESEWTSEAYYKVQNPENLYNGIAKCYISTGENVVKESGETVVWNY